MNTIKKSKIAVIGLDCKFPGQSNGPDQFWESLLNKRDGIIPIPPDRWDHSFYYDAKGAKGKTFVDRAGFISDVFDFSPSSFGMSEKEAADIDPQQRLLILSSWNSIQNAGYTVDAIKENTGVFFGLSYRDYYDFDIAPNGVNGYTASNPLGTVNAIAAGRVAYLLGLNGPAIQLDTICSSSLMTLHLACQSLQNEECDYALSGGVNCILSPHALVALAQMGALSKSAKCQAFSQHADGYIRGEGVGVVLLKRLEDAERDGDYIYGVVESTATNHDGRSNGLTAPNCKAQIKLIESCLKKAGLSPEDIGYVEAHGTGTYLGDPVELDGLYQVFGNSKSSANPLFVGSVKSNIGHLEPAAGAASLIKSLLILKNNVIPAGLHLKDLNPSFKWSEKHIVPVKENRPWENNEKRIGISAFSMTGANVHAIVGKAPDQHINGSSESSAKKWPVMISAQNEATLNHYISSLLYSINEDMPIPSISNTLMNGRELFEESVYAYFSTTKEFILELEKFQNDEQNIFKKVSLKGRRKRNQMVLTIGNFTDFNQKYLELWKKEELFTQSITKIDHILTKLLGKPLDALVMNSATELEQKMVRFSQAFIWTDGILSILKTDAVLNTSGEGDYLGAVFSGLLSIEEALLLFILEEGPKRIQLLEKIAFRAENHQWEKAEKAANKEFWLEKKEDSLLKNTTLNVLNDVSAVSISQKDQPDQLSDFLLYCYANGVEIDWTSVLGNRALRKVPLPPPPLAMATYISESYRTNSRKAPGISGSNGETQNDMITSIVHHQLDLAQDHRKGFTSSFSPEQNMFIKDHIVNGIYIFPGSGYLSMISEALFYLKKSYQITLRNVQIFQPMSFQSLQEKREVQLDLIYNATERSLLENGSWEIKSRKDQEDWTLHIKGGFEIRSEDSLTENKQSLFTLDDIGLTPVDTLVFYDQLSNWGVEYGPEFRLVNQLKSDQNRMKALVKQHDNSSDLVASPELLDACMHALFSAKTFKQFSEPFVPSRYDEINFYKPLHGSIHASGKLLKTDADAMKAQFSFCDSEGNPIMEITSMEIRKILSQFLEPEKETDIVYEEKWEKLEINLENNHEKVKSRPSVSKEIWVFLNASQAQQTFSVIAENSENFPQISLIGQDYNTTFDPNISIFTDISSLIKSQKGDREQFILFAPPIEDIKGLSLMFAVCKEIILTLPKNQSFRLCTVKGIAVHSEEEVNPFHTALWGLARTMPIEAKQRWKGVIDIASIQEVLLLIDSRLEHLLIYDQLAVRNEAVYTPILTRETDRYSENVQPKGNWKNPVLITGGLGQMGRVFTEQLVKLGCTKIYLLSRNPAWFQTEDSQVNDFNLSQSQLDFRQYVKQCGSEGISIVPVAGKVDSSEDMAAVATLLKKQGINEINLIHAAGAVTRNRVTEANPEELEQEWKAKYEGALQLDQQFENFRIGFTMYTSSIASLWSGEGVAGYSSANLLLDGLAINRNLAGKRTLSVRFGRFTEKGLMKEHEAQELESSGILTLPMNRAIHKALELATTSDLVTPGIMHIDWKRFTPLYQLLNHNQLLSFLDHQEHISENKRAQNSGKNTDKPLREIIQEMVADELEIDISEIDPSIPLFELGLNSIHSLGIRTDLEQLLNIKLSVSLIYDFNTVDLLSKHLEELTQKVSDSDTDNKEENEDELLQLLLQELK